MRPFKTLNKIIALLLLLPLLLVKPSLAVEGPLRGYWNFEAGCLPSDSDCIDEGNKDASGNGNDGYFGDTGEAAGNYVLSDLPSAYASDIALVPFYTDARRGTIASEPMRIDQVAPIDKPLSLSLFYRLGGGNEFADAWSTRCDSRQPSAVTSYAEALCPDSPQPIYLLDTFGGDSSGNGLSLYLNEQGEIVTYLQVTTSTSEVHSIALAVKLYDPSSDADSSAFTRWFNVGVSYNPKVVVKADGQTNLILDVAMLLNGQVVARDQKVLPNNEVNPDDNVSLFGSAQVGSRADNALVGLIDEVRFYNRALTSFELSCVSQGGQQCVKQEIVGGNALKGFRGISVIDVDLATMDVSNDRVPACYNDDGSPVNNCAANDLVITLFDASTSNTQKMVLAKNFVGTQPEAGLSGKSVIAVGLGGTDNRHLKITYQEPLASETLCDQKSGTWQDEGKLCTYESLSTLPIQGDDVKSILVNYRLIDRIEYSSEQNTVSTILSGTGQGATADPAAISFDPSVFNANKKTCGFLKGNPGREYKSARWLSATKELQLCLEANYQDCKEVAIPQGSRGGDVEGETYTCQVPVGNASKGMSGKIFTSGHSFDATNKVLTLNYEENYYNSDGGAERQTGTLTIPMAIQPGQSGNSRDKEVLVYSQGKNGSSYKYSGQRTIGAYAYNCQLFSSASDYISICTRTN